MNHPFKTFNLSTLLLVYILMTQSFSANAAVHLSESNKGQAMLVPFYTVANNLNTLLSIDNSTDQFKAIKVNLREGRYGQVINTFNLYLTPYDVWSAALSQHTGFINFFTQDTSCTVGLNQLLGPPEDLPNLAPDYLTGTIEVIEMGVLNEDSGVIHPPIYPYSICEQVNDAWYGSEPIWSANPVQDIHPPSGGLSTQTSVIDVASGFAFTVPVVTLEDFHPPEVVAHHPPETALPDLNSGQKTSLSLVNGEVFSTNWPTGYEAISALLMKTSIQNELNLESALAASTEWILTFPTWPYHQANESTQLPFVVDDEDRFLLSNFYNSQYSLYTDTGSEHTFRLSFVLDPPPPPALLNTYMYGVVNTINLFYIYEFEASLLSGDYRENVIQINTAYADSGVNVPDDGFIKGRFKIDFNQFNSLINDRGTDAFNNSTHLYHGLPVTGFSFVRFLNAGAQPGLLATYATAQKHQEERLITVETD